MTQPDVSELMVRGIVVGVFAENCWVIGSRRTREGIVIDPGDQAEDILHLAKDMGLNVKLIANSHAHIDHILGVRGVQQATNAKFLLHPQELEIARGAAQAAQHMLGQPIEPPPDPDRLLAGYSDGESGVGELYATEDRGDSWRRVDGEFPAVRSIWLEVA